MGKPINVSGGTLTAKDHAVINNVMTDSNGIAESFGNKMNHRLDSVNMIAILDGFAMVQGRAYVIYPGDEEKLIIKNGSQGMKRHDLVVLEFDNSLEELKLKVLEGAEDSSSPADPELTQEDTLSGGNLYQMPLYRVVIDGLTVSVEDLREYLTVGNGGGVDYDVIIEGATNPIVIKAEMMGIDTSNIMANVTLGTYMCTDDCYIVGTFAESCGTATIAINGVNVFGSFYGGTGYAMFSAKKGDTITKVGSQALTITVYGVKRG